MSVTDKHVVFVLGGPGAGKGTQCARLAKDFGFAHFSAGDLLRNEVSSGSPHGKMIDETIRNGLIVPKEITIGLLEKAMKAAPQKVILIDGFPRQMDQAIAFEETVCPCEFVLFLDVSEEQLEKRLLKRGETSGRTDDNADSIRKRFHTFRNICMPVIDYYGQHGKMRKIDSGRSVDEVFEDVRKCFASMINDAGR